MVEKLSIIVAGQLIGEVEITPEDYSTSVNGGGIIGNGDWDMRPDEIKEMLCKRIEYYRNVAREEIEIKYS